MSVLGFALGALILLGLGVVRSLAAEEAKGRLADLAGLLVERAVSRLPAGHQDEKRQEWQAELAEQRSKPLGALHWSWNLYRSSRSTAHELRADTDPFPTLPEVAAADPIGSEPLHPRLQAAVDFAKQFGWRDVLAAMQDPGLGEVERSLGEATDRFCGTVDACRAVPRSVVAWYAPQGDPPSLGEVQIPAPPMARARVRSGGSAVARRGRGARGPVGSSRGSEVYLGLAVALLLGLLIFLLVRALLAA